MELIEYFRMLDRRCNTSSAVFEGSTAVRWACPPYALAYRRSRPVKRGIVAYW